MIKKLPLIILLLTSYSAQSSQQWYRDSGFNDGPYNQAQACRESQLTGGDTHAGAVSTGAGTQYLCKKNRGDGGGQEWTYYVYFANNGCSSVENQVVTPGGGYDCEPAPAIDNCTDTIAQSGGNGSITQNNDGTITCTVGVPGQCTIASNNMACVEDSTDGTCPNGSYFGYINGNASCVNSNETNAVGSSDPATWGSENNSEPFVIEDTTVTESTNSSGNPQTETTTSTTTTTDTTTIQPDQTAAPITCSDGRLAANLESCDSALQCDPNYYLAYGYCIPLPSVQVTETQTDTDITTTTVDTVTGTTTTTTTTGSTNQTGGNSNSGTAEISYSGPCDPSHIGYSDCVNFFGDIPTDLGDNDLATIDTASTQVMDDYETDQTDSINDVINADTSYADGIGAIIIDLFDFGTVTCNDITMTFRGWTASRGCSETAIVRGILAWLLSLFTIWGIFTISLRPPGARE